MRIEDVSVGDVVYREPDSQTGWFEVAETTSLFNGDIQLADRTELLTISGPFFTIVGVQFVSEAEVPDQPPSPLPPVEGEDVGAAEQTADADTSPEAGQTAQDNETAPVNHFAKSEQAAAAQQPAPVHQAAPVQQSSPADQSANSGEDYGDQSHAEKGALPQLPSRQSQPVG